MSNQISRKLRASSRRLPLVTLPVAAITLALTASSPASAAVDIPIVVVPAIGIVSVPPPFIPQPGMPGLTVLAGGVLMPPFQPLPPPPPPPPPPPVAVAPPIAPPPPPPPARPARQDRY